MQQPVSMPRIGTPACMSATHVPFSAALSSPPSSCVICTTMLTAVRGWSAVIRHGSSVEIHASEGWLPVVHQDPSTELSDAISSDGLEGVIG